jgi:carboxylesterase
LGKTNRTIPVFQNPHLNGKTRYLRGTENIGFLLIHGFTATTVEVSWLGEFLNGKGHPVLMPLLPGHGTTPEDLNAMKYQDWIDCVESAYLDLSSRVDHVIAGGESMGAVLALHLAAKHPEIKALLLYSPALQVPMLKKSRWLRWIMPIIMKQNYDDEMPWQGYTVYPLKAAFEFYKMQQTVRGKLSDIKNPLAIFHSKYDRTIDPNVSDFIFNGVSSMEKKMFYMGNSGHVMLLDREFDQIALMTYDYLKTYHIL